MVGRLDGEDIGVDPRIICDLSFCGKPNVWIPEQGHSRLQQYHQLQQDQSDPLQVVDLDYLDVYVHRVLQQV